MTASVTFQPVRAAQSPFDAARAERTLDDLTRAAGALAAPERDGVEAALADAGLRALLAHAAGSSPYLARLMIRDADALGRLVLDGADAALAVILARIDGAWREAESADALMATLRRAKRQAALVIALADLGGVFGLEAVTADLTALAETALRTAFRFHLADAARAGRYLPKNPDAPDEGSGLVVLGMGKFGAAELNYSSDIDFVVFFEREVLTVGEGVEKQVFCIRLVQAVVKTMQEITSDGYVFRTDLRLRPDAGATQVAISTEAAEIYYEGMGQNWERAAMIKARPVAGDIAMGEEFLHRLAPFVWRKYLDFAAIEDIHSIKRQIDAAHGHGHIAVEGHNVKLGRGGIREIEFFAQTQQLILGGRQPSLRRRRTFAALDALTELGHVTPAVRDDLKRAYEFLRTLEHRLQMTADEQTHELPKTRAGVDDVARFMGYPTTNAFISDLTFQLKSVQTHYAALFEKSAPLSSGGGNLVFTGVEEDPATVATLGKMGFKRASDVSKAIRGWHHGRIRATRSPRAREKLTLLMPVLLEALAKTPEPDTAFMRFDAFLGGLPGGIQVFSLLLSHTELLGLIAEACGAAPRLASYLARNPAVIDALIDPGYLTRTPPPEELLAAAVTSIGGAGDYEEVLNAARQFAREQSFRICLQVVRGVAPPSSGGPGLSAVADAVLKTLMPRAEDEVARVHGHVPGGGMAMVALGRLGGRGMTATSDLDLMFIYDHADDVTQSEGPRPLASSQYFGRTSQSVINALTAMTSEGRLYEVDMRLRPSGNKGPVATKLESFVRYHETESWTWERLALTRARVITGEPSVVERTRAAIRAALTRRLDPATIRADTASMRARLLRERPPRNVWDLKLVSGGLVDIEFIAQSLQLVHAPDRPDVLDSNTVAALRKLKTAGFLDAADAEILVDAAGLYHAVTQIMRIALDGEATPDEMNEAFRALLARSTGAPDFASLEAHIALSRERAGALFQKYVGEAV